MRDKYGVTQDRYCYPGSDVLINLLGIRDAKTLAEAEAEFTAERFRTYQAPRLVITDFTLHHLQHLHCHLFQDIYEWAGKIRDVDISKGDTRFCTWSRIEPEANKQFSAIPNLELMDTEESLISKVADLFCEINLLHPFREGKGRVQRFFFEELLFTLGYDISWPRISQKHWIDANIAGVNLDLSPLEAIFAQAISNGND
jgi:cell filamentation protein